jgi:hypothetical protein
MKQHSLKIIRLLVCILAFILAVLSLKAVEPTRAFITEWIKDIK